MFLQQIHASDAVRSRLASKLRRCVVHSRVEQTYGAGTPHSKAGTHDSEEIFSILGAPIIRSSAGTDVFIESGDGIHRLSAEELDIGFALPKGRAACQAAWRLQGARPASICLLQGFPGA